MGSRGHLDVLRGVLLLWDGLISTIVFLAQGAASCMRVDGQAEKSVCLLQTPNCGEGARDFAPNHAQWDQQGKLKLPSAAAFSAPQQVAAAALG
jgi:hypothetical protein